MSDRTSFQVHVYACPEDQREAALGALTEAMGEPDEGEPGELEMMTCYEISVGTGADLSAELVKVAPGASFLMWEDPAYQWLGDLYAYTPELGMFTCACDADGTPVMNASQVTRVIEATGGNAEQITEAIYKAMGDPWLDDWREHTDTPAGNGNG